MPQGIQFPVYFKELGSKDGSSPTLSVGVDISSRRRKLLVPYQYMELAAAQLTGYATLDSGSVMQRWLPQEDWKTPGLFATQVNESNGIGWRAKAQQQYGSLNVFELACLEVDFEPRPYPILSETDISTSGSPNEFLRFVEVQVTPEGEYLGVPANMGIFKWGEGHAGAGGLNSALPNQPGKIVSTTNYTFKWEQVPDLGLPPITLQKTLGKTNKSDFGNPAFTPWFWPAGTLLMIGAGWKRTFMFTPTGVVPSWHVEVMVKYNVHGHTRLYNFKDPTPDWYQVSVRGAPVFPEGSIPDGKCIYDESEFDDCFDTTMP